MTPSERMKEIEVLRAYDFYKGTWRSMPSDIDWLIARVKRLTEALEFYAVMENRGVEDIKNPQGYIPFGTKARKALEDK